MSKYHNAGVYGGWIRIYYILCSKIYATFGGLFCSSLVCDGLHICEPCLLYSFYPNSSGFNLNFSDEMTLFGIQGFKDSKTFIWQRKYMLLDNNPSIFHFMRSKPISYNIHGGKHCGHWTLIDQLHMEWQSILRFINAFRKDKFATSGDPY